MDDIQFEITINGSGISISIDDFGERLADYEPFWKWKFEINNRENKISKGGPNGGFFSKKTEAIADCFKELAKHLEKKEILIIKKHFLKIIKINKIKQIIQKWNQSSGSLESDSAYIELLCNVLKITNEPKYLISEKEKLTFIFDLLHVENEMNLIQKISNELLN